MSFEKMKTCCYLALLCSRLFAPDSDSTTYTMYTLHTGNAISTRIFSTYHPYRQAALLLSQIYLFSYWHSGSKIMALNVCKIVKLCRFEIFGLADVKADNVLVGQSSLPSIMGSFTGTYFMSLALNFTESDLNHYVSF